MNPAESPSDQVGTMPGESVTEPLRLSDLSIPESTVPDTGVRAWKTVEKGNKIPGSEYLMVPRDGAPTSIDRAYGLANAEKDEVLRQERRKLIEELAKAKTVLEKAQTPREKSDAHKAIEQAEEALQRIDDETASAQAVYNSAESFKRRKEDAVHLKSEEIEGFQQSVESIDRQLEILMQRRSLHETAIASAKRKLSLTEKGFLTRFVFGRKGSEDDTAAEKLKLEQMKNIKVDALDHGREINDDEAQRIYITQVEGLNEQAEARLVAARSADQERLEEAQRKLQEENIAVASAASYFSDASSRLAELLSARREAEALRSRGVAVSEAEAATFSAELETAQASVATAEDALRQAEEQEDRYWKSLSAEFAKEWGEVLVEEQEKAQETAQQQEQERQGQRREKVRSLLSMPDADLLNVAFEVGRDANGEFSIDTAVNDMAVMTEQLLARYRKMEGAVSTYTADRSGMLAKAMATVASEESYLAEQQELAEAKKFGVLNEAELEVELKKIDDSLTTPEVTQLKQELVEAKAWLDKPAHQTEAFKRMHASTIRDKKNIVVSHERDLKKATKNIEQRKKDLARQNETRQATAQQMFLEWENTFLKEHVAKRKGEELRAVDAFLGALKDLDPAERKLAMSSELTKAMGEAQAVLENLGRWKNLLENQDAVVDDIARVIQEQDQLVAEAEERNRQRGAELAEAIQDYSAKEIKRKENKDPRKIPALQKERDSAWLLSVGLRATVEKSGVEVNEAVRRRDEAIAEARKLYLPIELSSANIAQSQELQFARKKGGTDIRKVYTSVMWGGEAHAYDGDTPLPRDVVGIHEQWVDNGLDSFSTALSERLAVRKAEIAAGREPGKETEPGNLTIEEALQRGAELIHDAVLRAGAGFGEYLKGEGAADRFIAQGGLQALALGVEGLTDMEQLRTNLQAQLDVIRAVPNGKATYAVFVANAKTLARFANVQLT